MTTPHPAHIKDAALEAFARHGKMKTAAREAGVPPTTLRNWVYGDSGAPPTVGRPFVGIYYHAPDFAAFLKLETGIDIYASNLSVPRLHDRQQRALRRIHEGQQWIRETTVDGILCRLDVPPSLLEAQPYWLRANWGAATATRMPPDWALMDWSKGWPSTLPQGEAKPLNEWTEAA